MAPSESLPGVALRAHFPPSRTSRGGKAAFIEALCRHRAQEITSLLKQSPGLIFVTDDAGRGPLHICARQRVSTAAQINASLETARVLRKAGVDVNAIHPVQDDGEIFPATALWYALAWGRNPRLASQLLKWKADPHRCLFALVYADDLLSARQVRKYGAAIDEVAHGETPLIYAIRHSRVRFIDWLLKEGADPNFQDRGGFTALHHAVRR